MFKSRQFLPSFKRNSGLRKWTWLLAVLLLVALPKLAWAGDVPHSWRTNLNVRQLFESGGAVGIVLAALSVAMLALVLEHLFSLRAGAVNPRKLAEHVHQLMHERQFKIAAKLCRDDGSLLGFVLAAGLNEIGSGPALVEKAMEDACAQYSARLYRKIDSLSVIGTLSPMLGLLGTVWGMMIAFGEFASKANVQVTELAPGISTALVTTLMGLAVAIPAYAAFAYFRNRVDEAVSTCSQLADHLFLEYRRAQAARRRKARAVQFQQRPAGDYGRTAFPSVAIEREKSA
jgi:biopolymer transport protein ExbB